MKGESTDLYREYGIDARYDDPNAYGVGESHYGNGKYPPDWDRRREAVWDRQRYQCARCGVYKGDVDRSEVHHLVHLAQGGPNSLDNLLGLCANCHALMHPDVSVLDGSVTHAPVFPDDDADDRVAVVRWPDDDELRTDLSRVAEASSPERNRRAVTPATVATDARTAKRASSDLHRMLTTEGYVPRTSSYHRVRVAPILTGYRGVVSSFVPSVDTREDGTAREIVAADDDAAYDLLYTPDTRRTTIALEDGAGDLVGEDIQFDDYDTDSIRVQKAVDPPPFTPKTAPRYALGAAKYFGWRAVTWGLVPTLLLALFAPQYLPVSGVVGYLLVTVLVGLLLGAPFILREFRRSAEDEVVPREV